MKIAWREETPRKIQQFPGADYPSTNPDLEDVLTSADVDHVAQIFQTPLTGSYNWDYSVQDDRIKKLYELGKQLNWDPQMDIDWDRPWPEEARAGGDDESARLSALSSVIRKRTRRVLVAYECLEFVAVSARGAGSATGGQSALFLRADVSMRSFTPPRKHLMRPVT